MISYEYRIHIAGDAVRVEAFDFRRHKSRPAFELEAIDGLPIIEYALMRDDVTVDSGPNLIPVPVKVQMIGEMEEALLKLQRTYDRLCNA
jgi:hypothetical protein